MSIETIQNVVINEIQRVAKRTADSPGSFGAYVDLSNMAAGDTVAFWLEYDVGAQDAPIAAGSAESIAYEDLISYVDQGGPNEQLILSAAFALEPVTLELNQVTQIAFVQTAGVPKEFNVRNTKMEDGS